MTVKSFDISRCFRLQETNIFYSFSKNSVFYFYVQQILEIKTSLYFIVIVSDFYTPPHVSCGYYVYRLAVLMSIHLSP